MRNSLNWFEIPATDIERAARFYQQIFQVEMVPGPGGQSGFSMSMFPDDGGGGVGCALVAGEGYVPSASGAVVYPPCKPRSSPRQARVAAHGFQVILPRTDIGENGFYAFIIDTEGNRVNLAEVNRALSCLATSAKSQFPPHRLSSALITTPCAPLRSSQRGAFCAILPASQQVGRLV